MAILTPADGASTGDLVAAARRHGEREGKHMTKEQIMGYIPKSKKAAVYDAWQDSDGIWIMLNEGWNADRGDSVCRTIHEDTIKDLRYQISGIRKVER